MAAAATATVTAPPTPSRAAGRLRSVALLLGLSASCALIGCRTGRPDYVINVPPNLGAEGARPPRTVLSLRAPLRLDPVEQVIRSRLPVGGAGSSLRVGPVDLGYRVTVQPAMLQALTATEGGGLGIRYPISIDVAAGVGLFGCRSTGLSGTIVVRGRPTIDESGALYFADPRVELVQGGRIDCVGINVPAGDFLNQLLMPIRQLVAQVVPSLRFPLGSLFQRGAQELARPRPLSFGGQPACLDLAPSGLVLSPLTQGPGSSVALKLGIEVAPRLLLGECPSVPSAMPPQLSFREQVLGDEFAVMLSVAVPTSLLEPQLAAALNGKTLGAGANTVVVRRAQLGDANGRALVRLEVTGGFDGEIFLWGTPTVQPQNGRYVLSVPDLRMAVETESVLTRIKLALYQAFAGSLADMVKPHLVLDITDRVEQIRATLRQRVPLTGDASLSLVVNRIEPQRVESHPGVIVLYALFAGTADLETAFSPAAAPAPAPAPAPSAPRYQY